MGFVLSVYQDHANIATSKRNQYSYGSSHHGFTFCFTLRSQLSLRTYLLVLASPISSIFIVFCSQWGTVIQWVFLLLPWDLVISSRWMQVNKFMLGSCSMFRTCPFVSQDRRSSATQFSHHWSLRKAFAVLKPCKSRDRPSTVDCMQRSIGRRDRPEGKPQQRCSITYQALNPTCPNCITAPFACHILDGSSWFSFKNVRPWKRNGCASVVAE